MKQIITEYVAMSIFSFQLIGAQLFVDVLYNRFDYFATKTGSIIVPACGFDSVPSDVSAYLANKTLKSIGPSSTGEYLNPGTSTSAFRFYGGLSGGSIASVMTSIEKVPFQVSKQSRRPYSLSPYVGLIPRFRFLYSLPVPGSKTIKGGIFVMGAGNRSLVQRTFGLLEIQSGGKTSAHLKHLPFFFFFCLIVPSDDKKRRLQSYGPDFCYSEFQATSGTLSALFLTTALIAGFTALFIKPVSY